MNLEVLKNPKQGVYELNTAVSIEQPEVKGWLVVEAIMHSNQSSSRSLSNINDDTVWFPFKLFFDLSDVQTNKELEAHLQSSDTVVFL
ncbi:hypothetical protein [Vibrio parahaemolyticus]|uniref:hypothetical protein n=1 Tax=Vibrio parahaemolyticus TaxID=670 RepID=UPI001C5A2865|nr:hypothetical protein [Vibrio parahaemolyticus]